MNYPVVADEGSRLEALRALQIVGTPRTAAFDAIAKIATDIFACPIAFISLLEKDQQWFMAECGLGASSTPREIAFCNYTVLGSEAFIVEDARRDPRFADNPLVTGAAAIRFYAGVPITLESGHRIGALCVSDTRPRQFSDRDIDRLHQLGKLAEASVAAHEQTLRTAAVARDAAEKAQLLWKKGRLLRQMERIAKIGGWELDLQTQMVDWSDEVSRIHELPIGDTCSMEQALSFYPEHWRAVITRNIEKSIASGEGYTFESEFVTALGNKKWVRAAGECELRDGQPVRLFGMFQDITQEKAASEQQWRAANYDEVTGLANRRHFNQALSAAIKEADQSGAGMTLMILDLDNFKQINDTRGHSVGDELLAEVGQRLAQTVAEGDFVARLGGDEFAIISHGCSPAQIERNGRRILERLKEPVAIGPTHVYVSGTLGIARFPEDATNAPNLLKNADLGLYSAKHNNRGSISRYSPNLATLFERHTRAADLVREALAQNTLVPFYQPKVRLEDGAISGFEALARIQAADGKILGPRIFAPAFEDREMAQGIGKRMLHAVSADIASWREAGLDPFSVSLNVCEADFTDGKLAGRVLQRLDELALPHSCLTIEVTETVFLGDGAGLAREALIELDAQGVKIELDDFGTGYASLTHLRAFPINRLKIDRSFIADLEANDGASVIVQAVVELGHNLKCEVIAEGVETEFQAALLREMGCDAGQGFLFGRPTSAKQARKLLHGEAVKRERLLQSIAGKLAPGVDVPSRLEEASGPAALRRS